MSTPAEGTPNHGSFWQVDLTKCCFFFVSLSGWFRVFEGRCCPTSVKNIFDLKIHTGYESMSRGATGFIGRRFTHKMAEWLGRGQFKSYPVLCDWLAPVARVPLPPAQSLLARISAASRDGCRQFSSPSGLFKARLGCSSDSEVKGEKKEGTFFLVSGGAEVFVVSGQINGSSILEN